MLIAIDHGNYAIKTPHHSFVSGLSEHTVKPPMADEILEYDGRYWTTSGKRLSYMRDKTQDERYFILTLFAIAKELEDTGRYSPVEQIQLAVGLPPEHYGVLKDKFARYFKRDGIIKFVYKDKPYSIMIDKVMVFPQAYAAVVPKSSMVVNMLRVFVVDIGGYTTDVLLLKNGKPDLQFCRSLETGIITMNNEIIRKVGALHDMRIEDEHISAVLSGQDTILPDDVKEICTVDYKTFGQNIRRLRVTQGFRQEDLAEKCGCTTSHIGQIENGRVKPSLEMTVRIANALNATTDQLLAHEFSHPEEIYLKEIAKRIEKYPVSKRILACEGFNTYLDSLEKFSKT